MSEHRAARPWAALAVMTLGASLLAACGSDSTEPSYPKNSEYRAQIQRTGWGIPHITAPDEAGLGYGVGYAFAQDNFCVLADEMLTVNGERSKWFGPDASNIYGRNNLRSDFYFKLINDQAQAQAHLDKQNAESRALIRGYVAGVNRYLSETGVANLPGDCKGQPWVRAITELDMARLVRRLAVEASGLQFSDAIYAAQPPAVTLGAAPKLNNDLKRQARTLLAASDGPFSKRHWDEMREQTGSNAVALGAESTTNGVGHLLGNPHFPWFGVLRFYQLHVTIPGKMDVMGGALTGFPGVNIGFNQNIAWSHTVNTSAHFTLFALSLDPADPTRYIYDGVSRPMEKKTLSVEVKGANGVTTQTRSVYASHHGPIVVRPGQLEWTRASAFALKDANLDNWRLLEQWNKMNRASSLAELRGALETVVGIPWVNTIAVDRGGNAMYANISVVPGVSAAKESACIPAPLKPLTASGLYVLAGSTAACEWDVDASTPQPGIFAGKALPVLERRDWVQNSNDSAWLSNPAAPLTAYPNIVSRNSYEQNGRTRIGISQIGSRLAGTDGLPGNRFDLANLQNIVLNNRVYYADLALEGLMSLACTGATSQTVGGVAVDLAKPCATLAAWDRRTELASVGFPLFAAWWDKLGATTRAGMWAVPFSAADPVNTPRGIRSGDAALTSAVRDALANAVLQLASDKIDYTKPWGNLQVAIKASPISVHGGDGTYGVYNAIRSSIVPQAPGVRVVNYGTSYIQTVTWDGTTPRAEAFLTYSNSTNPSSPNYGNQTLAFMGKQWIRLPYTQDQIRQDPFLSTTLISQ